MIDTIRGGGRRVGELIKWVIREEQEESVLPPPGRLPKRSLAGRARGGWLEEYSFVPGVGLSEGLLIRSPAFVEAQIAARIRGLYSERLEGEMEDGEWTAGYVFDDGAPLWLESFCHLLTSVVTLPPPDGVEAATALDWYNIPGSQPPQRTDIGSLLYRAKYPPRGRSGSFLAMRELRKRMVKFILAHPAFEPAVFITAPPGSSADGRSFAERLAKSVARATKKRYVRMYAPRPRFPQKLGMTQDLSAEFTVKKELSDTVIVLDDVYRSGSTLSGAAMAARRAGAETVVALTAARTLTQ